MITAQEPPKGFRMSLNAIGTADHQHRAIQHAQCALGLRGEVHMTRCIQQREFRVAHGKLCLFGKDGNTSGSLQRVGIQITVTMIHTAEFFNFSRLIQHGLGKGGFSRIHMGQNADDDFLHKKNLSVRYLQYNRN